MTEKDMAKLMYDEALEKYRYVKQTEHLGYLAAIGSLEAVLPNLDYVIGLENAGFVSFCPSSQELKKAYEEEIEKLKSPCFYETEDEYTDDE